MLYDRINRRVDAMMAQGLLQEVRGLLDAGYSPELVSMQGLGYKEFIPYFNGEISLEDAVYTLKRDTRHFAKRQLTWFGREREVIWLNKASANAYVKPTAMRERKSAAAPEHDRLGEKFENEEAILDHILNLLKERGIYNE